MVMTSKVCTWKALGSSPLSNAGWHDSAPDSSSASAVLFFWWPLIARYHSALSILFLPSLGFSVIWLLSVRVREALEGTSPERSYWRLGRLLRKQLKGQQLRSHPVPKFQPKILKVIFVPLQPCAASAAKGAQHNVDRSIQNICCEPSFGSAKAEFVGWGLGRDFMVAFPHSHGNSPSVGCRGCRAHLSCSSPFIWRSAPTGRLESENRLCYDRDLQIL